MEQPVEKARLISHEEAQTYINQYKGIIDLSGLQPDEILYACENTMTYSSLDGRYTFTLSPIEMVRVMKILGETVQEHFDCENLQEEAELAMLINDYKVNELKEPPIWTEEEMADWIYDPSDREVFAYIEEHVKPFSVMELLTHENIEIKALVFLAFTPDDIKSELKLTHINTKTIEKSGFVYQKNENGDYVQYNRIFDDTYELYHADLKSHGFIKNLNIVFYSCPSTGKKYSAWVDESIKDPIDAIAQITLVDIPLDAEYIVRHGDVVLFVRDESKPITGYYPRTGENYLKLLYSEA
jgi:hypothetical protein